MRRRAACFFVVVILLSQAACGSGRHNYGDALEKSILFFEGQRSGRLPPSQRMDWRGDSGLHDGSDIGVDLVGGYYDAGDNIKFGFPMAFTTTMLSWGIVEFGRYMGSQLPYARDAVSWATDYLLKVTDDPSRIHVQVGDPFADHDCWERPEDMDTPRTVFTVDAQRPGSEVAAETAAALAAASIVFKTVDPAYAAKLLNRSTQVFGFADAYRGSYNSSIGKWVTEFYCDFSGHQDELVWAAIWLYRATGNRYYRYYVAKNIENMYPNGGNVAEFGWDDKSAGVYVLAAKTSIVLGSSTPQEMADAFVCAVLPESPSKIVDYSPGGLLFKSEASNMQNPTALSFLLVVYAQHLRSTGRVVYCGDTVASPSRLVRLAKSQVDYILGANPQGISYMVGYGERFPQRVHHRASSLPSLTHQPGRIFCQDGSPYYQSPDPNPNPLTGAIVGGPNISDAYMDSRSLFVQSEPTTYINAPMVGLLAYIHGRRRRAD